jgi:nucleoside 2-deoxyribosyltransferase
LDSIKIYFAGSIRGGRADVSRYFDIIELLREYGRVLTEHVADARLTENGDLEDDYLIHNRDMLWLKEADCLIAEVTVPSLGVGYEIGTATQWGKPVLCLFHSGDGTALSAMISGSDRLTVGEYQNRADIRSMLATFFATSF